MITTQSERDGHVQYLRLLGLRLALEEIKERLPRVHPSEVEVIQVGRTGFYYKQPGVFLAKFMAWDANLVTENGVYF